MKRASGVGFGRDRCTRLAHTPAPRVVTRIRWPLASAVGFRRYKAMNRVGCRVSGLGGRSIDNCREDDVGTFHNPDLCRRDSGRHIAGHKLGHNADDLGRSPLEMPDDEPGRTASEPNAGPIGVDGCFRLRRRRSGLCCDGGRALLPVAGSGDVASQPLSENGDRHPTSCITTQPQTQRPGASPRFRTEAYFDGRTSTRSFFTMYWPALPTKVQSRVFPSLLPMPTSALAAPFH